MKKFKWKQVLVTILLMAIGVPLWMSIAADYAGTIEISKATGVMPLGADYTWNLTASETATVVDMIATIPKNLGGNTLTIQLADGDYLGMTVAWDFNGFYNGEIAVSGNTGESGLHSNQAVDLYFDSGTSSGLTFTDCDAKISVTNIHVKKASASGNSCIHFKYCSNFVTVEGCYTEQDATTAGYGLAFQWCSNCWPKNNNVDGHQFALLSGMSTVQSTNNVTTGVSPTYGLVCGGGGVIGKDGTQPTAGTAEYTDSGGVIR